METIYFVTDTALEEAVRFDGKFICQLIPWTEIRRLNLTLKYSGYPVTIEEAEQITKSWRTIEKIVSQVIVRNCCIQIRRTY